MLPTRTIAFLLLAPASLAQVFAEIEPNSVKSEATPALCTSTGVQLTGTTSGSDVTPGSSAATTADVFRIRTCARPPGVYAHMLGVSPSSAVIQLLGRNQVGTPGSGGTPGTADVVLQTSIPLEPRVIWYGSGREEEVYVRVSSSSPVNYNAGVFTVAQYVDWIDGTFQPGPVTISTVGLTSVDSDVVLYDSNFVQIGANDDEFPVASKQSRLTRSLAPGTYYVCVDRSNLASADLAAADEGFPTGALLDFPGGVATSNGLNVPSVQTTITDGTTTQSFAGGTPSFPYQLSWLRFTVGASPVTPFCFGDGSGTACPCGPGAVGHGCPNSAHAAGGRLDGAGSASLSADTLTLLGTDVPNTLALYFQGQFFEDDVFSDGIVCMPGGDTLIRLGTSAGVNGSSQFPAPGGTALGVLGQIPGAGATRLYQAWYRDPAPFCTPATTNYTNAVRVVWGP